MKRIFALLLIAVLLPAACFSESKLSTLPLVFSNEYADIYFDTIAIEYNAMLVYCVCENKTDKDLSFRMKRFLVNKWDIVTSPTFDGFFRVSAGSRKRDCFRFDEACTASGIFDPDDITSIDFSLELSPWSGSKVIFSQDDYTHYDLPREE